MSHSITPTFVSYIDIYIYFFKHLSSIYNIYIDAISQIKKKKNYKFLLTDKESPISRWQRLKENILGSKKKKDFHKTKNQNIPQKF